MANLIITIISIGLVAIAAIMGAYYGGTAFLQGQDQAYANTVVAQGEQIVDAWTAYTSQTGGSYTGISDISSLSLSPTYLGSLPIAPPQVANSTTSSGWASTNFSTWHIADLTNIATSPTTSTSQNGVYFRTTDDNNGVNTCVYVSQIAAGLSAQPTSISSSTNLTVSNTATRKFDCVYYASVSTYSTPPAASTNPKYIYYRAY